MLFSPFFLLIAEPGLEQSTRRVTRGQVSRLLQIPFVRGPASRASMQFVGSVYWNRLPANIRCHEDILGFKALLCPDVLDTLSLSWLIRQTCAFWSFGLVSNRQTDFSPQIPQLLSFYFIHLLRLFLTLFFLSFFFSFPCHLITVTHIQIPS